jgi:hypothetical protein
MRIVEGVGFNILYVDRLPVHERTTDDEAAVRRPWVDSVVRCWFLCRQLVDSDEMEQPVLKLHHRAERRVAEARRVG